jgi:hypothetical protein
MANSSASCDAFLLAQLSGTKSDPAVIGDHLDESCSDPIVVLGDEDSLSAQHCCHLVNGRL